MVPALRPLRVPRPGVWTIGVRGAAILVTESPDGDPAARRASYPGGVAQLVERHVRNVEVGGSSPLTSTTSPYSNFGEEKSTSKGSL